MCCPRGARFPVTNPNDFCAIANWLILSSDERYWQTDLVRLNRTVPVEAALQAELLVLRHQLNAAAQVPKASFLQDIDRLVFAALNRLAPGGAGRSENSQTADGDPLRPRRISSLLTLESRSRGGRPKTPAEIHQLIPEMSVANPPWGTPRIQGELLKLGIDILERKFPTGTTVASAEFPILPQGAANPSNSGKVLSD
jgi:hypothetical protein